MQRKFCSERLRDTISRQISLGAGRINPTGRETGILEKLRHCRVGRVGIFDFGTSRLFAGMRHSESIPIPKETHIIDDVILV
jgi:hypothetical protein